MLKKTQFAVFVVGDASQVGIGVVLAVPVFNVWIVTLQEGSDGGVLDRKVGSRQGQLRNFDIYRIGDEMENLWDGCRKEEISFPACVSAISISRNFRITYRSVSNLADNSEYFEKRFEYVGLTRMSMAWSAV